MTLIKRNVNISTNTIPVLLFLTLLCLLPSNVYQAKSNEMELMISMYVRENLDATVFQNGGERRTYAVELLDREKANAGNLGIQMASLNETQLKAIQPPANDQEKGMQEFKIIQYLLKQEEMNEVTQFSPEEERCLVLRRFVASLPFTNADFDDWFILRSMAQEYFPISYRELTMKILTDSTLFEPQDHESLMADLIELAKYKTTFLQVVQRLELTKIPVYTGNSQELREKANEKMEEYMEKKIYILAEFSESQAFMMDHMNYARQTANNIYSKSYNLELAAQVYMESMEFYVLVNGCDDPDLILQHAFMEDKSGKLGNIKNQVLEFAVELKAYNQIHGLFNYMVPKKKDMAESFKIADTLGTNTKKSMASKISAIQKNILKLQKTLYDILLKNEEYKNFLDSIEEYKEYLIQMATHYDKINEVNNKIDKLHFLASQDERLAGGDIVAGMNVSMALDQEILNLQLITQAVNKAIQLTGNTSELSLIQQSIAARKKRDEDRLRLLLKAKSILDKIGALETKVDMMMAMAFSRAMTLVNSTGDSENRMACFDEIELGHVIMMMGKTNMIIDVEMFLTMMVREWDYVSVKKFVLKNYFMFTSATYQGQSLAVYAEKKFMPNEEAVMKKKIIDDYALRLNFFLGLYKKRVESINFNSSNGVLRQIGLFFSNVVHHIKGYLARAIQDIALEFVMEHVMSVLKTIFPFIGTVQTIYKFMGSMVYVLLEDIYDYLRHKFYNVKLELDRQWRKVKRTVSRWLGNRQIKSAHIDDFFLENNAWMSWRSTCWRYDYCFEEKAPEASLEPLENKNVFYFESLEQVNVKYKKNLQIQRTRRYTYRAINYIRHINHFKGSNYLLTYERLEKDPNLLITACLYYKGKTNVQAFERRERLALL